MFTSKGKLIYDPRDPAADRKGFQFWWAKLDVHPSIIAYYQYWIRRELGYHVNTPMWKAHITVVRGEEPRKPFLWKKYQNRSIEFHYSPQLRISDTYMWLPVESPDLEAIRVELGLAPQPRVKFHITIGNTKNLVKDKKDIVLPFKTFPWERPEVIDKLWRKQK